MLVPRGKQCQMTVEEKYSFYSRRDMIPNGITEHFNFTLPSDLIYAY
jgi:hypothetical protein